MRSALVAVLTAALLVPAVAAAQSSPFQPFAPAPTPAPAPETVPVAPKPDDGGISALQQALLILSGVVLVFGIGLAIARDARKNAPVEPRPGSSGGAASAGDAAGTRKKPDPRAARKHKAAAKRARQARKKNRPVRR